MKLIGMLDSPYVRRVAISLDWLGLEFEHLPLSVFADYSKFEGINPVVKAPTLVCDDGTVLMDSSLILQYAESLSNSKFALCHQEICKQKLLLRAVSLSLAACDKCVQLYYEYNARPREYQYLPWIERVNKQISAAYSELNNELESWDAHLHNELNQVHILAVVSFNFAQKMLPEPLNTENLIFLLNIWKKHEESDLFKRYPPSGPGAPFQSSTPNKVKND